MNYNQSMKYLLSLQHFGTKLGLANITRLLNKLGNPHKGLKVIHVAGTNGKGSVCAMISNILQKAGYRVGMYTSPHLRCFNERFLVNGKKISNEDVARLTAVVKRYRKDQTFFEVVTAMAFQYFKEKKVDFLILEVGLGGRLDATNVIVPLVSVITNVDIDHTDYLGKNIVNIAYEKAGIIKKNKPVVTAAEGKALKVIENVSKEKNSDLFLVKKPKKRFKLALIGNFQQINAAVAVRTVETLNKYYGLGIAKKSIDLGLETAYWPGRLEFIADNILVDCAHNLACVKILVKELQKIKKKIILVIGISKDKDKEGMLNLLEPLAYKIVLTKADVPRATDTKELAKYLKKDYKIIDEPRKALKYAESIAKKNDLILVAGSIYVVGGIYK
ncbi:bifunctional folylpolyglutamate synthase/dihydrofolate synthase [Candidatus Woesearchaeota archaeon]|nr:bifunctional folylpolyglutamate synthase/dihydrofolate synthase [Candidatus Woesearchaeota archaeon]